MKKIPTIFERNWGDGPNRYLVFDKIRAGCEWVVAGEGIATRKIDGTSCRVESGKLWKRRELRAGEGVPPNFEVADHDKETGKTIGWIPIGDGPEDKWHREAFWEPLPDGTYELVGPKIQGNPEGYEVHTLVSHQETGKLPMCPRTFDELREFLDGGDIEGVVFHHSDGRMSKIKARDFGLKRVKVK